MITAARSGAQRMVHGQVTINRNGRERNLSVRVSGEQSGDAERAFVVTLDDITELVPPSARRHGRTSRAASPTKSRIRSRRSSFPPSGCVANMLQ